MTVVKILAIETSCDETAAAVVAGGRHILSSVVSSQVDLHKRFGGVVPEIASRSHQRMINPVIDEAMVGAGLRFGDLDAIAVTYGPGLLGALMIGVATAKALAFAAAKPLIGVNHLEGHLFANFIDHPDLKPPFIALIVSGGHTMLVRVVNWGEYLVLGQTLDDAAGEAFDKIAKFLGLGYPGGPVLSRMAADGDPRGIDFPRAMIRTQDYNFSLSGLKTAVINYVTKKQNAGEQIEVADVCAAFEAAAVDVQVYKTVRAAKEFAAKTVVLAGGVAANTSLRTKLTAAGADAGFEMVFPSLSLCTDNAAMIAAAAFSHYQRGDFQNLELEPEPNLRLEGADFRRRTPDARR